MTPEDAERVLDLFAQARALPAGAARADFLARACAGNDTGAGGSRVAAGHGQAPSPAFLAQPAFERGLEVHRPRPSAPANCETGETVGDCRVHSLLGTGGMGEVYLAD